MEDRPESLASHSVAGRSTWTQLPPSGSATAAVIFLDGELYIDRVKAPAVLRRLQEARAIPPLLAVYVSNQGAAARHRDFTCNADYARFVATDLVDWVRNTVPDISSRPIILAGLSLSGLAAAFAAQRFPDRFSAVICQSPSFWWEDERFRQSIPPAPDQSPPYWISVGDLETETNVSHPPSGLWQGSTQIAACQRTCDALRSTGYTVNERTFPGGHDPNCWRDDLELALPWAFRKGRM